MNTKIKLLELLERNRGKSQSGEQLAGLLGVSRAAVWKAIKALESEGHIIHAATNRGYALANESDILSVQGIAPYLTDSALADNIYVYKELESTNKTAKEIAISGCVHGTCVIADCQTAGKGRRGRSFCSPPGNGLYISVVLHSERVALPSIAMITAIIAVAVCEAIETVTGLVAGIKWVNDIIMDGKKVCGILTEGITDLESGNIDWVVAGIGINVGIEGIPQELRETAGSIFGGEENKIGAVRNHLAALIINKLLEGDIWCNLDKTRENYRSRLVILGKEITVLSADKHYEATALDIDELCRLIIRLKDGSVTKISSGETSVRTHTRNGLRH